MSLQLLLRSLPVSLFLLRCAGWLVPGRERTEWLAEWRAEVWHVWHLQDRNAQVTDLCLGAFQDAFWLRWYNPRSLPRRILRTGSASRCSLFLSCMDGDQLCGVFISAGHAQGHESIAVSGRGWTGDDCKWRLRRHTGSDHTAPGLSIMEAEHPAFVYRHCVLSTGTQASAYCHASTYRTYDWPGKRQPLAVAQFAGLAS